MPTTFKGIKTAVNFRLPLILSPLGAGPIPLGGPELVSAVSNAGGLGSLGCAYLTAEQIQDVAGRTKALIKSPTGNNAFAMNLFIPAPRPSPSQSKITPAAVEEAILATRGFRKSLGLHPPDIASFMTSPHHPDFDLQFAAVLKARPQVFSFVFGMLDSPYVRECQKEGILTMGTATTVDEALALEESGVDVVIAQGMEAGGHRGTFDQADPDPALGTLELTKRCVDKSKTPVVSAGGLMTGADIAKVIQTGGAHAAMLGTAFLLCPEASTSTTYRRALKENGLAKPVLTRAFSGRLARGLQNEFTIAFEKKTTSSSSSASSEAIAQNENPSSILPFPAQNYFTRDIRKASQISDRPEYLSLWAGEGVHLIREMPAARLVQVLEQEMTAAGLPL